MRKKEFFVYIKKKMNSVCVEFMVSFVDYIILKGTILATVFLIVTYRS